MNWIYRLNWWYDDQPEPRRFLIFFIPMVFLVTFIHNPWNSPTILLIGTIGLCLMAFLRIIPLALPRRRD